MTSNKKLITIGVIAVVIFVIYKFGESFVSKVTDNKNAKADVNESNLDSSFDYKAFALRLRESLEGISFTPFQFLEKEKIYSELLKGNDDEVKHVYNLFNKLVNVSKSGTLRSWTIEDVFINTSLKSEVLSRFDSLQLV